MSNLYVETETLPLTVYGQQQVSYVIGGEGGHTFAEACVSSAYKRAVTQEGEITPLSNAIRKRTVKLEELGTALSYVSNFVALYAEEGLESEELLYSDPKDRLNTVYNLLVKYGLNKDEYGLTPDANGDYRCTKASALKIQADLQTATETENNAIEQDTNTLQSFVSKRDQAYTAIGKIQNKIFKSMNKTIDNIGGV